MNEIPEVRKFCLEVPPYAEFQIGYGQFVDVLKLQFFQGTMDAHCAECGKEGVFQSISPPLRDAQAGPRTSGPAPQITVEQLLQKPNHRANWPYELSFNAMARGALTLAELEPLAAR